MEKTYKCKYCGNNLTITDAVCPYCGKENEFGKALIAEIDEKKSELEEVKKVTKRKIDFSTRTAKLTIILALMIAIIAVYFYRIWSSDLDIQYARADVETALDLSKNSNGYKAILDDLIEKRAYLELSNFELNNHLMHSDAFDDYYSVFQCSTCYDAIYRGIMEMIEHTDYVYNDKTDEDMAADIANYVDGLVTFSSKEELYYTQERFTPEKSQYIDDIKKEASDMVIVFFGLDKDIDLYSMSQDEITELLQENCKNVRGAD